MPSLSLCLSPLSVSFLRFGPPTAAAGKVLSPFFLPHFLPPYSQHHASVSVPSITFGLCPFWPLFTTGKLCITQISSSYLKSVAWDLKGGLFSCRKIKKIKCNDRKTVFVQEMSVQPGHIMLRNLFLERCKEKKTETPNCLRLCIVVTKRFLDMLPSHKFMSERIKGFLGVCRKTQMPIL